MLYAFALRALIRLVVTTDMHHGYTHGDDLSLYLALGNSEPERIRRFLGSSEDGRHIAVEKTNGRLRAYQPVQKNTYFQLVMSLITNLQINANGRAIVVA